MQKTGIKNILKIIAGIIFIFFALIPLVISITSKDFRYILFNFIQALPFFLVAYLLIKSGLKKQVIAPITPALPPENNVSVPEPEKSLFVRGNHSLLLYSIVCCVPTIVMVAKGGLKSLDIFSFVLVGFLMTVIFFQLPFTIASVLLQDSKHAIAISAAIKLIGGFLLISSGFFYYIFF